MLLERAGDLSPPDVMCFTCGVKAVKAVQKAKINLVI